MAIIILIPVLLWFISRPVLPRFTDLDMTLTNIGQLLGLIGVAMFALSLILSSRLHVLENYFNGLNKVYERHNQMGQIAFIILLLHPLFLLPEYSGHSWYQAALFLSPTANWPVTFGLLALGLMIILLVLTLYLRPKYNLWKITHKFLGLAFFLALIHVYLIPSDTSRYLPLRIYMLTLFVLALLGFSYRTLLGYFLIKKYQYAISKISALSSNIVEISMFPLKKKINFIPGQFIFIKFLDKNLSKEIHPFSISSGSNDKNLSVTIKALGDYTTKVANLTLQSGVEIEGPFGTFSYQKAVNKNQIWIAGGIGITPFLSMARSLQANENYQVDLYYCIRNDNENICKNLPQSILSLVRLINFYSDKEGYINAEIIQEKSGTFNDKDIFICAPPLMIKVLKAQFIAKGVNKKNLHSEEFNF